MLFTVIKKYFKDIKSKWLNKMDFGVYTYVVQFSSVHFSHSVMSDSLRPHELQYARPPCPQPTPGVYPNPCPLSRWYTIQPSDPLLSPSPPAFNLSQYQDLLQWLSSLHQVAKVLASVLPMNIQNWFLLGLTNLISLLSKGLLRVFSSFKIQKRCILYISFFRFFPL